MALQRPLPALSLLIALALAGCATPGHVEPYRDVSCLGMTHVSLIQAIEAAERSRGIRVIDAEFNMETEMGCLGGDHGHYDIVFYQDGTLSKATIDANNGAIGPEHREGLLRRLFNLDFVSDWPEAEMRSGGPAAARAALTMPRAVAMAARAGELALAAHVKTDANRTRYAIELVDRGQVRVAFVDFDGRVSNE